ncbi:hypothetical protein LEMA_P063000.1 [Plenodomus lingam JN3]|uniref:Methyltransferase type 12 domain-containing protein n=1 Tax=Leptosphaeria maculans (strain JN3 / isolate v23.1.3 / race Av1-4-5-6-7-8) TaxID=985895 RepID=E4ZFV4_LEPMJ|nr:hypothetical protein LEMA_P063000.1 [Plenodomus lingam JN3]CBX90174.1 hypothetical protein LEMA_P063000.1 [Plenodomus lingam JN3]
MASSTEPTAPNEAQLLDSARFQTNNTMSPKPQPKQQLSKAMEHMRFAVTVDPIPHTPTSISRPPPPPQEQAQTQFTPDPTIPTENDAYGVPASIAPVRAPPSRSHDPANNQKRSDPFSFGSRYLEEGDNIFEFNAWDHVTVDSTYQAFSQQQYAAQRLDPVSDFDRKRYMERPEKWWNQFYKNNKSNFFKNRKWLSQEFPVLADLGHPDAPAAVVLEVGAGAGNSAFPILQNSRNPRLKIHACDFSSKAVDLIRANPLYDETCIRADVWDVASPPSAANTGLPPGLAEASVDVVLMIFIFSALAPTQWHQALCNIWRVLKPGGQVLFRDYGRGDLAQVRFKKGRYLEENFYVRGDGTRVYFFEQDELRGIWEGATSAVDGERATAGESAVDVTGGRMLVNRQRRLKMYRCWLQAVFRKPGGESRVATSRLGGGGGDGKGEEGDVEEGKGHMEGEEKGDGDEKGKRKGESEERRQSESNGKSQADAQEQDNGKQEVIQS